MTSQTQRTEIQTYRRTSRHERQADRQTRPTRQTDKTHRPTRQTASPDRRQAAQTEGETRQTDKLRRLMGGLNRHKDQTDKQTGQTNQTK